MTTPSVQFGGERVALSDAAVAGVALFVSLYAVTLMLGTFVLLAHGYSLQSSLFEFASSLGTVGLSIGVTTPTTAPGVLWAQTVAMFLGRLEFFVVLYAIDGLVRDGASVLRARTP